MAKTQTIYTQFGITEQRQAIVASKVSANNEYTPAAYRLISDCKSGSIRLFFVEVAIFDVDPGETNVYDGENSQRASALLSVSRLILLSCERFEG